MSIFIKLACLAAVVSIQYVVLAYHFLIDEQLFDLPLDSQHSKYRWEALKLIKLFTNTQRIIFSPFGKRITEVDLKPCYNPRELFLRGI